MDSVRIMGIDPGTNVLGYAVIEVSKGTTTVLTHGVHYVRSEGGHQDKLFSIFLKVQEIIERYHPQEMAIEAPFHGKNVQSMLKLGRAQGVSIVAAMTRSIEVQEYSPKKIKQSVTGNGNASKEQVAAMVYQLIANKVEKQIHDATDALAAAICHSHQRNSPMGAGKSYKDWGAFLKANPDRLA